MAPFLPTFPFRSGPRLEFQGRPSFSTMPTFTSVSPNSARLTGGTAITIRGSNFRRLGDGTVPSVSFQRTTAGVVNVVPATSVVVVDQSTITCVAGAGSAVGVYDLVITVGSQTVTAVGVITYYASQIIGVFPRYGPLVGGTSVVIEGINFLDGTLVLFGGQPASQVVVIDDQHISCVTPTHATGFVDVELVEPV